MAKSITFKVNEQEKEEFRFLFDDIGEGKRFHDRSKAIKESLRLMVDTLE